MIPSDARVDCKYLRQLIVDVRPEHFRCGETIGPAHTESATATRESAVADVVCGTEPHDAEIILHVCHHQTLGITVVCSDGEVRVSHEAFVHATLYAEVEHCLLLPVVNASDACEV